MRGPDKGFVKISARLVRPSSFAIRIVPWAAASRTLWYAMALCFFFNVDSGLVQFATTPPLSQYMLAGPSMGMPNIRSLYRRLSTSSTAIRAAINSDPKVEVSTVFCRLENQTIGARLQKIKIPVWDLRVTRLPAWSASTKHEIRIGFPLGSGAFGGMASAAA